jgi:cytochrome P450
MRANAAAVLDPIEPGQEFDLVQMGIEYSFHNWADATGLPADQHARLKAWAPAVGGFVRPLERRPPQKKLPAPGEVESVPGHVPGFVEAYQDMEAFWSGIVATHRDHDPDYCRDKEGLAPLPRAIVASVKDAPEKLPTFLRHVYATMWAGGMSTVAHLFANAVDVLLDNRDVWTQIREDRSLLDPNRPSEVIEEILRLRGPHPGLHKRPVRDVEVRGTVIPAGTMVQMYYLSANRDPDTFEDPDQFKPRGISRHLTFGFGTHTCIGQSYARLALKVFLDALLDKFERIERAPTPADWTFKGGYYTPDRLHVIGDPEKAAAQNGRQAALGPAPKHVVY